MKTTDKSERAVTVGLAGIGGYGEFYARELLDGAARNRACFAAAVDPAPALADTVSVRTAG